MHIDAHQHFWHYNDHDYGWISEEMRVLARDYLPNDLRPHLAAIGFAGTVAVQARRMNAETDFLLRLADRYEWILGVVGWVDFQAEPRELETQLARYSANGKFRGVRELIHDMPDLDYAESRAHVHAISRLAHHGLTYDLLLKPPHLRPAIRLVDRFPAQPFVVDHLAKPPIRTHSMSPWREDICALAQRPNVFCKLSGMVTEADWDAWRPQDLHPYLDVVLEAFGCRRVMIGSDWPVCRCAGKYEQVMQAVIDYVAELSEDEQERILGKNCRRFYGLAT